ncbi:MAG: NUDIX hydrolase [Pyrinomonadaceae bacterium]|nr:NUDIX hydrolase [Pyrinomonadaceae bacterium]
MSPYFLPANLSSTFWKDAKAFQNVSMQPKVWKRIFSKQVADCKVFKVFERVVKSDDKQIEVYVVENPDWVNVIALTENNNLVLIEQFRYGLEEVILELPGGLIDQGEQPEQAARRELLEETGFSAEKWFLLGVSNPNPAIQNNKIYHFLAVNARKTENPRFDENEYVKTKLIPFEKVLKLIQEGKITHSLVIAAIYFFITSDFASKDAIHQKV